MILTIKVKISYSKNGFWSQQLVVMLAAQVGPYSFILLRCHKCVAYGISRWAEKVSLISLLPQFILPIQPAIGLSTRERHVFLKKQYQVISNYNNNEICFRSHL